MRHLVDGVRQAAANECWYAAVALALTLPDTAASFQNPPGGQRYETWANQYLSKYFSDPNGRLYLTGAELRKLRNSFLHAGGFEPSRARPQSADASTAMFETLNGVKLAVSSFNVVPSRNLVEASSGMSALRVATYNISAREFCEAICSAVEDWFDDVRADAGITSAMAEMTRITHIDDNGHMTEF